MTTLTFLATMPPIQSAVKVSGNGDGMRLQIDVPESEMGNAIELLAMRGKVLRVTVELEQDDKRQVEESQDESSRTVIRTKAKRRK